ncbi:alanyl-tRNA editing protein [Paenibacillus campi]|uniref:alanyl-tRNA editing protein n=1 Tax=Paenibacillus campi TaxID=3106031 RepID=UPI002AFDE0A2|nr:DHHA1 domain-containing protein [Paenibacillus sp. SGZ-1014]
MNELYFDSSYLTSWTTALEEAITQAGQHYVVLKETAFYPHGGGQPCDGGTIDGMPVLDVSRVDGRILHQVPSLPEQSPGAELYCEIDWQRRFDHMQQHSGQHLLSATCLEVLNAPTLSFHLGEHECTIDIELAELELAKLQAVERQVNTYIYRNLPIRSYMVDEAQLATLKLVKPPSVTERVRIVEIESIEYNACGGTHVSRTGEIGIIKLYKAEKNKGNIRLYFRCGLRALDDYNESLAINDALAARFNTGRKHIVGRFDKWDEEQKQQREEVERLRRENDQFMLERLLSQIQSGATQAIVQQEWTERSLQDLQRIANLLLEQGELIVLLSSTAERKVVLAQTGHAELQCGIFFKQHLARFGGKGGGNDRIAQAGFESIEQLREFVHFVREQWSGDGAL